MQKKLLYLMLIVFMIITSVKLHAHNPDRSIIYLKIYETSNIEGEFHINVNELNDILGFSISQSFTVADIKLHRQDIQNYLLSTTKFKSLKGHHNIIFVDELYTIPTSFGDFISLGFYLDNSVNIADNIEITFKSFLEEDPNHINYVTIQHNWKSGIINNEAMIALVYDNENYTKVLSVTDTSVWKGFVAMVKEGIWHIWIGIDHILFLLALILPSVVRRRKTNTNQYSIYGWEPVMTFKPAFIYIIKVVTFFTIAHTITLTLASLEIVMLPSRFVESIIAFSIGLAAYHNIKPIFKMKDWIIAFIFGLFHGFGFASVLSDLGLTGEFLTLSLLGFNIGVELGQVAIIAGIFPVLYLIRKYNFYPKFLVYTSVLLIIISLYWFIERAFDINLLFDNYLIMYAYETAKWIGLK